MQRTFFQKVILCLAVILLCLPASALAKVPLALIGKNKIRREVAQTPAQIEHGLMERSSLPESQGMVFLFKPPHPVRFWMFNCLMSLDMIFIKDGKIVTISREVPPYKSPDRSKAPLYPAEGEIEASEVIEVNAGYCTRHGINAGDAVKFDFSDAAGNREPSAPAGTGK